MFQVPVVVIIFNRPYLAKRLVQELALVQPSSIYVISDGPRANVPEDLRKVHAARQIFETLPWPCRIHKNYAEKNLGCMLRVSSGLDWVFESEESAIILEDDCIPSESFFEFCREGLARYRDESQVMSISGTRLCPTGIGENNSYSFSKYCVSWGWATWADAWACYDKDLKQYERIRRSGLMSKILGGMRQALYWRVILRRVARGDINSWAYRWNVTHWIWNGLSMIPTTNLVLNVGVGNDATHTKEQNDFLMRPALELQFPMIHPDSITCDNELDEWIEDNVYSKSPSVRVKWAVKKVKRFFFRDR